MGMMGGMQSRPQGLGGLGLALMMKALGNAQKPSRMVRSTRRAARGARMPGMSRNSQRKKARTPQPLGVSTFARPGLTSTPTTGTNLLRSFLLGR